MKHSAKQNTNRKNVQLIVLCIVMVQDRAILDKIQREVGEMKVQERLEAQKGKSWFGLRWP